ncbi:hypothetical protein HDU96_006421 [Phlyctochytrium bullatum]|nr:hypothetical protein HDU96_006421 [Phlyctochytrium bullatum]
MADRSRPTSHSFPQDPSPASQHPSSAVPNVFAGKLDRDALGMATQQDLMNILSSLAADEGLSREGDAAVGMMALAGVPALAAKPEPLSTLSIASVQPSHSGIHVQAPSSGVSEQQQPGQFPAAGKDKAQGPPATGMMMVIQDGRERNLSGSEAKSSTVTSTTNNSAETDIALAAEPMQVDAVGANGKGGANGNVAVTQSVGEVTEDSVLTEDEDLEDEKDQIPAEPLFFMDTEGDSSVKAKGKVNGGGAAAEGAVKMDADGTVDGMEDDPAVTAEKFLSSIVKPKEEDTHGGDGITGARLVIDIKNPLHIRWKIEEAVLLAAIEDKRKMDADLAAVTKKAAALGPEITRLELSVLEMEKKLAEEKKKLEDTKTEEIRHKSIIKHIHSQIDILAKRVQDSEAKLKTIVRTAKSIPVKPATNGVVASPTFATPAISTGPEVSVTRSSIQAAPLPRTREYRADSPSASILDRLGGPTTRDRDYPPPPPPPRERDRDTRDTRDREPQIERTASFSASSRDPAYDSRGPSTTGGGGKIRAMPEPRHDRDRELSPRGRDHLDRPRDRPYTSQAPPPPPPPPSTRDRDRDRERDPRDARDTRDRDLRDARDPRDPRDARDTRDPRDARDTRDARDPRDRDWWERTDRERERERERDRDREREPERYYRDPPPPPPPPAVDPRDRARALPDPRERDRGLADPRDRERALPDPRDRDRDLRDRDRDRFDRDRAEAERERERDRERYRERNGAPAATSRAAWEDAMDVDRNRLRDEKLRRQQAPAYPERERERERERDLGPANTTSAYSRPPPPPPPRAFDSSRLGPPSARPHREPLPPGGYDTTRDRPPLPAASTRPPAPPAPRAARASDAIVTIVERVEASDMCKDYQYNECFKGAKCGFVHSCMRCRGGHALIKCERNRCVCINFNVEGGCDAEGTCLKEHRCLRCSSTGHGLLHCTVKPANGNSVCFAWNASGVCKTPTCPRVHECFRCGGTHASFVCPENIKLIMEECIQASPAGVASSMRRPGPGSVGGRDPSPAPEARRPDARGYERERPASATGVAPPVAAPLPPKTSPDRRAPTAPAEASSSSDIEKLQKVMAVVKGAESLLKDDVPRVTAASLGLQNPADVSIADLSNQVLQLLGVLKARSGDS